jgi:lipid A 3-O-deacylase
MQPAPVHGADTVAVPQVYPALAPSLRPRMNSQRVRGPYACLRTGVRILASLVVASAALVPPAQAADSLAPDGVEVTYGYGHAVAIYGAAVRWDSLCTCAALKALGFDTRLVGQVAYWHARERPTPHGSLWDTSVTPVLRWSTPDFAGMRGFVDAGLGVHLLSATRINNDRVLSTAFQFGEAAGAGVAFGEHHRYELGAYVQHISNARLKEPNNGLTYFGAVLRMALP